MGPPSKRMTAIKLPPPRKPTLKRFLVRGLIVLALVAGVLAYRDMSGAPIGGACSSDGDCKGLFGNRCLLEGRTGYCTHDCKTDADCEAGFSCGRIRTTDVQSGKRVEQTVCITAVARFEMLPSAVVGGPDAGTMDAGAQGDGGAAP